MRRTGKWVSFKQRNYWQFTVPSRAPPPSYKIKETLRTPSTCWPGSLYQVTAVLPSSVWMDVHGPLCGLLPLPPNPTGEDKTSQRDCTFKNPSGGYWAMKPGVKCQLLGSEEPPAEKQTHLRWGVCNILGSDKVGCIPFQSKRGRW